MSPVLKKRGTLKISTPNVPCFLQKKGTLKNSTPNVPRFMKQSFTTIKVVNRHNQCIMKRSNGFPRDPGECPVQGPQKLSEELERSEEFRGQFLRSEDWTFPRVPRKTVGPFHYTLVMPVYHFLLLISNVPQLRKRGTLGRLFFNVPHFLRKTWDIGSTVFQCPPLFAPMSHVL